MVGFFMETRWIIYCHMHVESGRRYIGLTKLTMMKRWNQHLANSKSKNGKGCLYFWNAIRKYGKSAFSHHVLEFDIPTLELANEAEEKWINFYGTCDPEKGFNLVKGGFHAPENPSLVSENASHAMKSRWKNPAFRANISQKTSIFNSTSRVYTKETRQKMSASIIAMFSNRTHITCQKHGKVAVGDCYRLRYKFKNGNTGYRLKCKECTKEYNRTRQAARA